MKRLLVAAALWMIAFDASAADRYDITSMSCDNVQAVVKDNGAVILSYISKTSLLGLAKYDRYVSSQKFCNPGEVMRGSGVPTVDVDYCPVKKCVRSEIFVSG